MSPIPLFLLLSPLFDWQGHRGARGLAPENTVHAFLKALEFPAITTLELDVVISKDLQVVVSHEPWVSPHICDCPEGDKTLNIYEYPYEEIRQIDCGLKKNSRFPQQEKIAAHKPILGEVAREVEKYCREKGRPLPGFNIELKAMPEWDGIYTPAPAEFAKLVLDEVNALGIRDRACLQSFDPRILRELHRLDPGLTLSYLMEFPFDPEELIKELGFTPAIISPYYKLVTRNMIDSIHQKNMRIVPWTVNNTLVMKKLRKWGVDGVITDYPDRIPE
ncbi:MAG: glycerophosphodiester phosphodiesterase [Saprospirales bacterium]|nr:glycerophosphodiester phosphodiesterase [Saprospirales bacterium]